MRYLCHQSNQLLEVVKMTIKMIPELSAKTVQALWSRVEKRSNGCWEYVGGRNRNYGTITINNKSYLVSRVVYKMHYSIDPGEMLVLHRCDNPPCCNPEHLFLGTTQDNVRDRCEKGRTGDMSKRDLSIYARGEKQGSAKLTADKVREIRQRKANGETTRKLARDFEVAQATVWRVVQRLFWKHVE